MTGVSCILQFCFFSKIIFQKLISALLAINKKSSFTKVYKTIFWIKIFFAQKHSPNRRPTLSHPPQNIIPHIQKHFADRRTGLYGKIQIILQTYDSKNTIKLFSNIEACFTIFLPFVVHGLIITFYKGLNFVYFPVWPFVNQAYFTSTFFIGFKNSSGVI